VNAYSQFLARKRLSDPSTGIVDPDDMPAVMKPHQRDITRWALRRGRAAVFAGTLQYRGGRENADERHIAPLQLEVIRRCIELWSAPGDIVMTPFAGIGSELFIAVEMGRKAIGVELKPSYFRQAVKNLESAETAKANDLFVEAVA